MENENNYVLAMYDVRAKQNYIYRTKKLKEIQGASWIIRDVFKDHLYEEAIKYRNDKGYEGNISDAAIYNYNDKENDKVFSFSKFTERMAGDQYVGEVVYDGGGNFFILYENKDVCGEVSYRFGRRLMVEAPGLNVLCTYIEGVDPQNYNNVEEKSGKKGDSQILYDRHRINENQESTVMPYGTLPIVQAEYISSMPYTKKVRKVKVRNKKEEKVTAEAFAKYTKFYEVYKKQGMEASDEKIDEDGVLNIDEKILDNLVTEKGRESLLAIIYIDGNNMGAKVQNLLKEKKDYDSCVNELRNFSDYINEKCVEERTKEIDKILTEKLKDDIIKKANKEREDAGELPLTEKEKEKEVSKEIPTRRLVVAAGDEITVICNARYAFDIAKDYLEKIYQESKEDEYGPVTSCAGIAIFHSHTPFADAYRIAEECCENGKKKMKKLNLSEACFLDFHYCQGAIGISLDEMREKDETEDFSFPWFMVSTDGDYKDLCNADDIKELQSDLNKIGRSNVKGLAEKAKEGLLPLELEIKRILAHTNEKGLKILKRFVDTEDKNNFSKGDKEKYRKLIYDIVLVYDIWFANAGSGVSESE